MKRLVLAVLVVLVSACATYPPPKIENGCYHNYKYGFMLDLPGSDWVPMEKPSSQLKAVVPWGKRTVVPWGARTLVPWGTRRSLMLSLVNKETTGAIFVLSHRLGRLKGGTEFSQTQQAMVSPLETLMRLEFKYATYCYDSSPYLQMYDACVKFEHEDAMSKSEGNMVTRVFPVGKNVNMITVLFASNHLTYEQNFPAFVEVIKSLRCGEEYRTAEQ